MTYEPTLAARVHDAYTTQRRTNRELHKAIAAIVGTGRLVDANVEHDSQYDNSVEVTLEGGVKLTPEERAAIKALGFDRVWNDERSLSTLAECEKLDEENASLRRRVAVLTEESKAAQALIEFAEVNCQALSDSAAGELANLSDRFYAARAATDEMNKEKA